MPRPYVKHFVVNFDWDDILNEARKPRKPQFAVYKMKEAMDPALEEVFTEVNKVLEGVGLRVNVYMGIGPPGISHKEVPGAVVEVLMYGRRTVWSRICQLFGWHIVRFPFKLSPIPIGKVLKPTIEGQGHEQRERIAASGNRNDDTLGDSKDGEGGGSDRPPPDIKPD